MKEVGHPGCTCKELSCFFCPVCTAHLRGVRDERERIVRAIGFEIVNHKQVEALHPEKSGSSELADRLSQPPTYTVEEEDE